MLTTVLNIDIESDECWRLQPERFWRRLIRVTAWKFRIIHNCKQDDKVMKGELTPE